MLVNRLQRHLENIYEVQSGYRVADFLIDDPGLARRLDSAPNAREIPEKLLIQQDGESLNLALYLDPQLLQRLNANDPTESLHGENLHDFWMALEGISHFLYLTWNARHERSVTLLEMELQAEVDKYILAAFLFGRQMRGLVPRALYRQLFEYARFDERLDAAERHQRQLLRQPLLLLSGKGIPATGRAQRAGEHPAALLPPEPTAQDQGDPAPLVCRDSIRILCPEYALPGNHPVRESACRG